MDKKILVTLDTTDIEEGKKLVEKLDQSNLPVVGAFWYYMDGPERYRLMIVTPYYEEYGPKKTYEKIQKATEKNGADINLAWDAVSALGPNNELYKSLRTIADTGFDIEGRRLTGDVINGTYIEDAYLYRVN